MISSTERFTIGDWRFAVRKTIRGIPSHAWIAWCAKGIDDLGGGPLDIPLDVEVYSQFGASRDEAVAKLKAEVLGDQVSN